MSACCSPTSPPSRRPSAPPARAAARSRRWRRRCASPRPRRPRSPSPSSPASCASGRSAWDGRRCASCRRPLPSASLTVGEVDAAFAAIGGLSGAGSQGARRAALGALFARATEREQRFLRALLAGDLRQGALEGVMAEAAARAAGVPAATLRRALMLRGDLGAVAAAALGGGVEALGAFRLEVGRPVRPMLASPAADIAAAMEKLSPAAVEWKLDGLRVQVHRDGGDVAVFTRTLDDITARVPEIVEAALALPVRSAVLDGEALALRADGRPHLFQVSAGRALPLSARFFDVLHADGEDVLDAPGAARADVLAAIVPEAAARPAPRRRRRRRRRRRARRRARDGPRGRDREVARSALCGRAPGRGLAQGQARAHARSGRARRRMGPRPPPRVAEQPPPRRAPRQRAGRVRDARQDLQGPDRRDAHLADRASARARDGARRLGRARPPRARGRDRLRRHPDQHPLSGRRRAALRARAAPPARQARRGGRHAGRGAGGPPDPS